jgi:hypothetical protein
MGFDPTRKFVPRRTDYLFVGAAVVAVIALLVWVVFG